MAVFEETYYGLCINKFESKVLVLEEQEKSLYSNFKNSNKTFAAFPHPARNMVEMF